MDSPQIPLSNDEANYKTMMLSDLYSKKSLLYLTNEHQTKVLNLKNYPIINGKIESFLGIGNVTTVIDIIIS